MINNNLVDLLGGGGFNHLKKYESMGRMTSHVLQYGKTCSYGCYGCPLANMNVPTCWAA